MKQIKYWLMKSEPESYSIDQFQKDKKTLWEGVRNYQARNFMMKDMNLGDKVLFYHSNANPPGAAGIGAISGKAIPDPSAFNKKSPYFDEKSKKDKPSWYCVEVSFVEKFANFVPLEDIKKQKNLQSLLLLKKGQRLSIQPLTESEFNFICQMGQK